MNVMTPVPAQAERETVREVPRAVRVIATEDSRGRRWAWCSACWRGHLLGRFLLDEWEPSRVVRWPCPRPGSLPVVLAVTPEAWPLDPEDLGHRARKREEG